MDTVDEKGLVDKNEDNKEVHIKKPTRTIVVEPLLMSMALFYFPLKQVSQLYVYGRMKEYVADKYGYNLSEMLNDTKSSCGSNQSSLEYKFTEEVQTFNSYFDMIVTLCQIIPSLFVILLLSAYSDKVGRKYAIIPPLIGRLFYSAVYLLVFTLQLPVWVIWIASFLNGLGGSSALLFAACFSYLADITKREDRQFRITVAEMSMFFCSMLGPIGVGYWIKKHGYLWPLVISFIGHVLNMIYVIFFVPETIVKDPSAKLFDFSNFKITAKIFTIDTEDKRRWKLWLLFFSFLIHFIGTGVYSVTELYELNIPLCWGSVTIGYFSAANIAVSSVGGIVVSKLMKKYTSNAVIALTSAFADAANCIYKGFVQNTIMMFLSLVFAPFWNLLTPTTRAMMSILAEPNEQGSLFGAVGIVETLAMFVGTEGMTLIYANTLNIYRGLVFFVGAIFYFVVGCMFIFYILKSRWERHAYQKLEEIK